MFQALTNSAPKMETRRALVFINMQNDTFGVDAKWHTVSLDIVEKAKVIVPAFRKLGDIIWVLTEITDTAPGGTKANDLASLARKTNLGLDHYYANSRTRALMKQGDSQAAQASNSLDIYASSDKGNDVPDYLSRTDQPVMLYRAGTHGQMIKDDLQPFIDANLDLQVTKHQHSAFDGTSLLMSLRMKFVTHIYLAGSLSNVSVYATASDAVRHGFEVTVVEDCLAYRSESLHIEAMGKMADFLGVSGVDSEEIISEASAGTAPPDADVPMFSGPGMAGINTQSLADAFRPPPPLFPTERERDNSEEKLAAMQSVHLSSPPAQSVSQPDSTDQTERLSSQGEGSPRKSAKAIRKSKYDHHKECGPGDTIGEGDSKIIFNALPLEMGKAAFGLIRAEADWQIMHHMTGEVPRRVAVQGELSESGGVPIYRHPADEAPPLLEFTPTVRKIRDELQTLLKQPFNHCLIQLYRTGEDNISEHSDKTLDVIRGSNIINLSLGAQRNMTLRTKKAPHGKDKNDMEPRERQAQRIPMPHNSVFVLGWRSNQKWLHGVRPDKRPASEKSEVELAYNGERISLTFRHIGTFVSHDRRRIWGQGARSKWENTAGSVSTVNSAEMEAMVRAFGRENQQTDFDWDAEYGKGFDVLNLVVGKSTLRLCEDELANLRVKMCVMHSDIDCKLTRSKPETQNSHAAPITGQRRAFSALNDDDMPVFREIERGSSEVEGDLAILFHLNKIYPNASGALSPRSAGSNSPMPPGHAGAGTSGGSALGRYVAPSSLFARITQSNELLFLWQELRGQPLSASTRATHQSRRPGGGSSAASASASVSASPASSQAGLGVMHPHPLRPRRSSEPSPQQAFEGELAVWEEYARESAFIAGDVFAVVDCAFWPVLDEIVRRWEGWNERRSPHLADYWRRVGAMENTRKALAEKAVDPAPPPHAHPPPPPPAAAGGMPGIA